MDLFSHHGRIYDSISSVIRMSQKALKCALCSQSLVHNIVTSTQKPYLPVHKRCDTKTRPYETCCYCKAPLGKYTSYDVFSRSLVHGRCHWRVVQKYLAEVETKPYPGRVKQFHQCDVCARWICCTRCGFSVNKCSYCTGDNYDSFCSECL